jgi:uncharacterized membrane protein YbhN (UPF0104 family)
VSRQLAWTSVRVAITVAIFAFLLRDLDWRTAGTALSRFSTTALAAFLLLIAADRLLMLARWIILMRMTNQVPATELARIFLVSSFVGSFLPSGVGADAARAISVTRQTREPNEAVASVVIDRLLGIQAVAITGCLGVLLIDYPVPEALRRVTLVTSLVMVAISVGGLIADLIVARLPAAIQRSWIGKAATRFGSALGAYRSRGDILWRVAALSFVVQIVRVLLAWVIGRGLGITLPLAYYWVFMPLNILVTLLPLSVGGFGVPQGAMVWSLGPLGISATEAFLLSLLFTVAGTIGNLPGALLYVTDAGARARQETRTSPRDVR